MRLKNFIKIIKEKPFIVELINNGGDVYVVGGVVRDLILNKSNKDIDLVVRKLPIDKIASILENFGKVDVVGKSFGVIKFLSGDGVDYDIALPRKEKPSGEGGYRGFDIQSNPNLSIEDDLVRRDAKFNAMAININTGKFIDPLDGLKDIQNKQVSAANPDAFSDDPLRMLRMVSFGSRFRYVIEPETMKMIKNNVGRIKEISPERILIELEKIVYKGDCEIGAMLLKQTGLLFEIFGEDDMIFSFKNWNNVKTIGEFIFILSNKDAKNPSQFYKDKLKGDTNTYKEIKGLEHAFLKEINNEVEARMIAHNMYVISPITLNSQILPDILKKACQELLKGKYPKTITELAVNGNELINLGLKGVEIGNAMKKLLLSVYSNKISNSKNELISFIKKVDNINETKKNDDIKYGCLMLFFDIPKWNDITSIIKKEDIYDLEGFGIETEPHVTILYGFHDNVKSNDVFNQVKNNFDLKPISITLNRISTFENPNFDVVKFDVSSDELFEINKFIKIFPHTSDYPDYHPHMTVGYVKKGMGKKYVTKLNKEYTLRGNRLVFSDKNKKKNELNLNSLNEASKRYETPERISKKDIEFIKTTG